MTAYNGNMIYYDGMTTLGNFKVGNPTTYNNGTAWTFTWEHGRQLATITQTSTSTTWTNTYNSDGLRTSRTDGTTTYTYFYEEGRLSAIKRNDLNMWIIYDENGPVTLKYGVGTFHYVTNLQGDVVAIVGNQGQTLVEYTYDAWGKVLSITGDYAYNLGIHNPILYRGYIYDHETGLYYCQSRYYDPQTRRFLNADAFTSTGGLLGNNMFAYCNNNPINSSDFFGFKPAGLDYKPTYYGEDQIFVDLTEKLNEFMKSNAKKLTEYINEHGYVAAMFYFYTNVNDGGELDIKLQDDWKFEEGTIYVYSGIILRHDDPGNINFGYIGAILFPEEILCFGAGLNQISKYGLSYGSIATYYDDPRDNEMIRLGVRLYKENMI